MSKAWKRLGPWLPGGDPTNDGDAALRALADVSEVRRLLQQAELSAVRVARRHRKSWTDIATMLAISRQSAWERWREVDSRDDLASQPDAADRIQGAAVTELVGRVRRRGTSEVPDVIGLTAADALAILLGNGFDAVSATPGIELYGGHDDLRPTVVVRQYPDPGTRTHAASTVRLWLARGDGEAGVREPRRPNPPPRAARAERDERTEQSV